MEGESGFIPDYKESVKSKIRYLVFLRTLDVDRGKPSEPQTHPEIEKAVKERIGETPAILN